MDFSLDGYKHLIGAFLTRQYDFYCFKDFLLKFTHTKSSKSIIIRHDIDRIPNNALKMAQLENELGIHGTYFFRAVPESFDQAIIEQISNLGHEVGYHYEDIDLSVKQQKAYGKKIINEEELIDKAIESFVTNLEKLRRICPIYTICMHGSPFSKYDNRMLWDKYDYRDYGIIGEPYFDIDFNEVFYLTDTGRRWNASSISVRDKVESIFNYTFKSTKDIILNIDSLPDKIMFNIHPQRWHDSALPWVMELISQNLKNMGKFIIVKKLDIAAVQSMRKR